ncbi:hypothetical protein AAC387_Pa01g1225 [Persea americana]
MTEDADQTSIVPVAVPGCREENRREREIEALPMAAATGEGKRQQRRYVPDSVADRFEGKKNQNQIQQKKWRP